MQLNTVEVHTLNVGDKFVLDTYSEIHNSVYLVYELDKDGYAECVELHSGKTFTFGRTVPVIPVTVTICVKRTPMERKPADLTGKCGSCEFASTKFKTMFIHQDSYVRCMNPARRFRDEISAHRPRTTKCCKEYKARE